MNKIILDHKNLSPSEQDPLDEMVEDILLDRGIKFSGYKYKIVVEYIKEEVNNDE